MQSNIVILRLPAEVTDKEQYLSKILSIYKNRKILSISKLDDSLKIKLGGENKGKKYFVRFCSKEKYESTKKYLEYYFRKIKGNGCKNLPELFAEEEYNEFFLLFFITKKRR